MENPKGITYTPIYEPDQERMVKALRIVLESTPQKKDEDRKEAANE